MGSSMKPTIFNERVAAALRKWHQAAKKHIKRKKGPVSITPISSKPATPLHHYMSPLHLLKYYQNEMDSLQNSPKKSNLIRWKSDTPSPSYTNYQGNDSSSTYHPNSGDGSSSQHHHQLQRVELSYGIEYEKKGNNEASSSEVRPISQHENDVEPKEFSFDRRASV